jgi:hypothetical protein
LLSKGETLAVLVNHIAREASLSAAREKVVCGVPVNRRIAVALQRIIANVPDLL